MSHDCCQGVGNPEDGDTDKKKMVEQIWSLFQSVGAVHNIMKPGGTSAFKTRNSVSDYWSGSTELLVCPPVMLASSVSLSLIRLDAHFLPSKPWMTLNTPPEPTSAPTLGLSPVDN